MRESLAMGLTNGETRDANVWTARLEYTPRLLAPGLKLDHILSPARSARAAKDE